MVEEQNYNHSEIFKIKEIVEWQNCNHSEKYFNYYIYNKMENFDYLVYILIEKI